MVHARSPIVLAARTAVLVIGAGPIGIEASVQCVRAGLAVTLVERGSAVGASVRQWGHCRFTTPYSINCSTAGLHALTEANYKRPVTSACPTGNHLCDHYLEPLYEWLELQEDVQIHLDTQAISITRGQWLKHDPADDARASSPFAALLASSEGADERRVEGFAAVLDCTGTCAPAAP